MPRTSTPRTSTRLLPPRRFRHLSLALLLASHGHVAADTTYESRIALHLIESVESARLIWLEEKGHSFLNLYTPAADNAATPDTATNVILLHPMGGHPDHPQRIRPLRLALAQTGRNSLSMQMPILPADWLPARYGETLEEAAARLHTGIHWMLDQHDGNLVIIAQGFGSLIALYTAIHHHAHPRMLGVAALGMREYEFLRPPASMHALLERNPVPVLDIHHKGDDDAVLRRLAARRGKQARYRQHVMEIDKPDAQEQGSEQELLQAVFAWIRELP